MGLHRPAGRIERRRSRGSKSPYAIIERQRKELNELNKRIVVLQVQVAELSHDLNGHKAALKVANGDLDSCAATIKSLQDQIKTYKGQEKKKKDATAQESQS